MISIIICDDAQPMLDKINMQIEKAIVINNLDMKVTLKANNPVVVLDYLEENKQSNIYFLDVDLKSELNGFELAKKIRLSDPRGYIVFITTHDELLMETFKYRVEAMDYIIKNQNDFELRIDECLLNIQELLQINSADNNRYYAINTGSIVYNLNIDEIIFFETSHNKHKIIVHSSNALYEFSGNLSDIENDLKDNFLRIHRSYLVSKDKIKQIDKSSNSLIMINNMVCPISRKAKKILNAM